MNFTIQRDELLKALRAVSGVVGQRQILPILSHILLETRGEQLSITATDSEVEIASSALLEENAFGDAVVTVPGKKLVEICKMLPDDSLVSFDLTDDWMRVRAGAGQFTLTTLPPETFPRMAPTDQGKQFAVAQNELLFLLQRTHFAIAHEDVRHFLNGMLLEISEGAMRAVATDGHRLAKNTVIIQTVSNDFVRAIVPRKAVVELLRLLRDDDKVLEIWINDASIRIVHPDFVFSSTLMEGQYPDYEKVLPKDGDKSFVVDRDVFKQALGRVAVLANEKFKGVRLSTAEGRLLVRTNNPKQEAAEEELHIDYSQEPTELAFNLVYLLDVLNVIGTGNFELTFKSPEKSVLLKEVGGGHDSVYVVMPLTL